MSDQGSSSDVDTGSSGIGFRLLQQSDFYVRSSLLHPLACGSIAIVFLFIYFRFMSNRCSAPVTLFDSIVSVALGSVLGAIVTGTSLTRGVISLAVLLFFQFLTSLFSSHLGVYVERVVQAPPLVIAFRGHALSKVMKHHRISATDLNSALRREKIWNIKEVECVVIEPTGLFTVYKQCDHPQDYAPDVLMDIKGYRKLVEDRIAHGKSKRSRDSGSNDDDIAEECA